MASKISETLRELIEAREYTIISEEDGTIICEDSNEKQIYIYEKVIEKLNAEQAGFHTKCMEELKITHGILIYNNTITPHVKIMRTHLLKIGIIIELFESATLQFNILKHEKVPKHRPLSKEEETEIRKICGDRIQAIFTTDPVMKFLGCREKQIIEITRKNGSIAYRIVKKGKED